MLAVVILLAGLVIAIIGFCVYMTIKSFRKGEKWMGLAYAISLIFMIWIMYMVHNVNQVAK